MDSGEKMYDLLEKIYVQLQDTKKELKTEIDSVGIELGGERTSVESRLMNEVSSVRTELGEFRGKTNKHFDRLEDKIDDLKTCNAERHISINSDLNRISSNLAKVELATADNWSDITQLKIERGK